MNYLKMKIEHFKQSFQAENKRELFGWKKPPIIYRL